MTGIDIKKKLVEIAIAQLEALNAELKDDVKSKLRGEGSTDEGGFSGTFGDYSAQATENFLKEQAMIRRNEAGKHDALIQKLKRLNINAPTEFISLGNLVETDRGMFFISFGLRPIDLEGTKYFLLGTDAPIYAIMAGKKEGESFAFRDINYSIISIQ
jgi:hypothetical protein